MKLKSNLVFSLFILLIIDFNLSIAQSKSDKIDQLMQKYSEYGIFNGSVLVSDEGNIIYKNGFGYANIEWNIPNTPDTKFELGSVTKQFTAALILQLVEEGKLKLTDKISDILPYYPKENGNKITIHQLLTHTSGIPNYTDLPDFINKQVYENLSPQQLIESFSSLPLEFTPGSQFKYSNSGYIVLGAIIEQLTGKSYEEVLNEKIFKPAGMLNSGYTHLDEIIKNRASGYNKMINRFSNAHYLDMSIPYSAGALYSTVNDLYKWDQALYGNNILSEQNKKLMFTGYIKDFNNKYGYGWDVGYQKITDNDSIFCEMHGGSIFGFSSLIVRIPEKKQLIVLLSNITGASLGGIYNNIFNVLYDKPVTKIEKPKINKLAEIIDEKGIDAGIEFYNNEKDNKVSEAQMNNLGYYYLNSNKIKEAIEIFKLNIKAHPDSYNVYDSMGEAYMKNGDKQLAVDNYKKSIEMNPNNTNGYDMLEKLGVKVERPTESKSVKVDPAVYKSLIGQYELQPGFVITITTSNNKIYAQATGQGSFEIYPSSDYEYYYKVVNAQITFKKDEDGKVYQLILHQNGRDLPGKKIE